MSDSANAHRWSPTPLRNATRSRSPWLLPAMFLLGAVTTWVSMHIAQGPRFSQHASASVVRSAEVASTVTAPRIVEVRPPGPWGQLRRTPITIEPPAEYFDHMTGSPAATTWFFPNVVPAQMESLLASYGFDAAQARDLAARAAAEQGGVRVNPDTDLVLGLSPAVSGRLHTILATSEHNALHAHPYAMRKDAMDQRLAVSGIPADNTSLLRSLLYPSGRYYLFSDLGALMTRVTDPTEHRQLLRTITGKSTWRVDGSTDVEALLAYWDRGRRSKSLRPLLESLKRVPGGAELDLAHLLPATPRKCLYTFPHPSSDRSANLDCHWTAFNFYNDPAVYDRAAVDRFAKTFGADHQLVSDRAFGDVILLDTPSGGVIHAAVYIADDLVFTKNGFAALQPWIVMKLDDMLAYYDAILPNREKLNYRVFRKK